MRFGRQLFGCIKKIQLLTILVVFVVALLTPRASLFTVYAQSPDKEQSESVKQVAIKAAALQEAIIANKAKLKELSQTVDSLEIKLQTIALELDQANKEIEATTISIDELDAKIKATQLELDRQKILLRYSMRTLYKQGGASPFELLVGSETFGAYVNNQEYLQRLKDGVQSSATQIVRIKQALELQRYTLKDLYKRQDAQKRVIVTRQLDQQQLLDSTKGDQVKYTAIITDLQQQFEKADSQLKELFDRKAFVSIGKVTAGQQIGLVGSSGLSTGPHIHFTVFENGAFINPQDASGQLIKNFGWPLPNSKTSDITQPFGCTDLDLEPKSATCPGGHFHYGLDIGGWYGDPVVAAADGDIVFKGNRGDGYGNVIIIDHGNNLYTYYPHLLD